MQCNDRGAALEAAAREVLETMFFAEPLDQPPAGDAAVERICATVEVHGTCAGRFTACLAEPAARELAEVFLAGEGRPGPAAVADVVLELANMLCGSVLERLEPDALFELAPPAVGPCAHAAAPGRILALTGGTLELYLVGQAVPPASPPGD